MARSEVVTITCDIFHTASLGARRFRLILVSDDVEVSIKGKPWIDEERDLSPRALKRLESFVWRGLSRPSKILPQCNAITEDSIFEAYEALLRWRSKHPKDDNGWFERQQVWEKQYRKLYDSLSKEEQDRWHSRLLAVLEADRQQRQQKQEGQSDG